MIKIQDFLKCKSVIDHSFTNSSIDDIKITTDSRSVKNKNTFIALYGENFDGNSFIEDVILKGIKCIVFCEKKSRQNEVVIKDDEINYVKVSDTYKFILELANIISDRWQKAGGKLIGITGSNGKTTNKEILYSLLNSIQPGLVHKTFGNLNNNIGVPLTLFELKKEHRLCIVEMGMNHRGEIRPLAKCANPSFGLVTSIGPAHLEHLKTLENIFLEKKELFDWIDKKEDHDKIFVTRDNDPFLSKIPKRDWVHRLNRKNYENFKTSFRLKISGHEYKIENTSMIGTHHQDNLAQCLFFAYQLYPDLANVKKLVKATESFSMPEMNRGVINVKDDTMTYLDAYNANPSSMMASVESFNLQCSEKNIEMRDRLYILGDMNELGDSAADMHKKVSQSLDVMGVEHAFFVGRYAFDYQSSFSHKAKIFENTEELSKDFKKVLKRYKAVFIKGSRSLQLESILDILD